MLKVRVLASYMYLNELVDEGYIEINGKDELVGGCRRVVYRFKK